MTYKWTLITYFKEWKLEKCGEIKQPQIGYFFKFKNYRHNLKFWSSNDTKVKN